jgi:CheY-like chemotaxis protein
MRMTKIMLVDDEKRILETMGRVLEEGGYEVMVADSGKKCLEILENEKPDLILMDVMMPDMDGWEVVEKIKKDSSNKDIKISMLTVKSRDKDVEKSLVEVGADYHISKPVAREELLSTVKALLRL